MKPLKNLLQLSLILIFAHSINAQIYFDNSNIGRVMNMSDQDGKALIGKIYEPGIEGVPFLNEDWAAANIKLSGGKTFKNLKAKINLESNTIYYLDSAGKTFVAMDGLIKYINFPWLKSGNGSSYSFRNGYPKIDKQDENFYYQLIQTGKMDMLKKYAKYIATEKNALTGEIRKSFTDEIFRYYLYVDGTISEIKWQEDYFLSVMADKQKQMDSFLRHKKINFKKMADIEQLVAFYNSLFK